MNTRMEAGGHILTLVYTSSSPPRHLTPPHSSCPVSDWPTEETSLEFVLTWKESLVSNLFFFPNWRKGRAQGSAALPIPGAD